MSRREVTYEPRDGLEAWLSDGEVAFQVFRFHDSNTVTDDVALEFVRNVFIVPRDGDSEAQNALRAVTDVVESFPSGRYVAIPILSRHDLTVTASVDLG